MPCKQLGISLILFFMVNFAGKNILGLLLVITMVIQPVAFSYAMTGMVSGMDHSQHQASASVEKNHNGHHVMDESRSTVQQQAHDDGAEMMTDCCNSAACCPAAVVDLAVVQHTSATLFSFFSRPSWVGVEPPAEIKPPRTLLG